MPPIRTPRPARLRGALLACAAALLAAAAPRAAAAQDTIPASRTVAADSLSEVRLTDGSRLLGRIVEENGDRVVIVTASGARVELRRDQIASIAHASGTVVNGEFREEDPNSSRLFFTATGRSIPKGQAYFGVYELFLPFVSYGVTDRFTISAGTPVIPEAMGELAYVAPKFQVLRSDQANASVGALVFFGDFEGAAGIAYGVGTFGSNDNAVSVGAGWGFERSGGQGNLANEPVLLIGAESRLGAHTKFITENYLIPGGLGIVSGGVRFFSGNLSADAGLVGAVGTDGGAGCCLPLVNFVYVFGRPKK
jgi:hypothetical protein